MRQQVPSMQPLKIDTQNLQLQEPLASSSPYPFASFPSTFMSPPSSPFNWMNSQSPFPLSSPMSPFDVESPMRQLNLNQFLNPMSPDVFGSSFGSLSNDYSRQSLMLQNDMMLPNQFLYIYLI